MSRKGENIYHRKDGRWEGRYLKHIPGEKPKYGYVYAQTYRECREKQRAAAAQWRAESPKPQTATRFCGVAEQWERQLEGQVKESTQVKYHQILHKHLLPVFGDLLLTGITHQRIEEASRQLLHTLSPRTVADVLSVLRSILRFAMLRGEPIATDGSSVRIRRQPKPIRVLSPGEQQALICHLLSDPTPRNIGILLSLHTGLRLGELCALCWEDISLPERLLHVRHTAQRIQNLYTEKPRTRIIVTAPKSPDSIRTIPLTPDMVRLLHSLPGPRRGYFLSGATITEPRTMQHHFARAARASGIAGATFHTLRHTFATRCVELGFDTKSLSEILGHSTVNLTLNRYVHPTMDLKRCNMQRLRLSQ